MVVLVFVLFLIMQRVKFQYYLRLVILISLLYYLLVVSSWVVFYFIYEIVFVLIMFVIMVLGYSYERLSALYLIIFYSFLFSRPCLMLILVIDYSFIIKQWLCMGSIWMWFLVASFIVKFPIFGFHFWLPVAHVEASTLGSILLAGILLKLGGIGVYYLVVIWSIIVKFHWLLLGGLVVILLILNLRDLKIIIAYSSIAHITLVFYVMNLGNYAGKSGAMVMMFYHGYVSPLIFWLVGRFAWYKTRSLIVIKLLSISYLFWMIVFILALRNIGFPPFIGFLREILLLKACVRNFLVIIVIILSVLFSCYYNIFLFWVFRGKNGWVVKIMIRNIDVYLFLIWLLFLNL